MKQITEAFVDLAVDLWIKLRNFIGLPRCTCSGCGVYEGELHQTGCRILKEGSDDSEKDS